MPLDGRRAEPSARAVVLSSASGGRALLMTLRRLRLHRASIFEDAAAWTHDVAPARPRRPFLALTASQHAIRPASLMQAKDGRTDAFLYFSSSAWLTPDHCVTNVAKENDAGYGSQKLKTKASGCRDTSKQTGRGCRSSRSVDNGPKRSAGRNAGGEKVISVSRGSEATRPQGGAPV